MQFFGRFWSLLEKFKNLNEQNIKINNKVIDIVIKIDETTKCKLF
jgi:hypothetical protein